MAFASVTVWLLLTSSAIEASGAIAVARFAAGSVESAARADVAALTRSARPQLWGADQPEEIWPDPSELSDEESDSTEESALFVTADMDLPGAGGRKSHDPAISTSHPGSGSGRRAVLRC